MKVVDRAFQSFFALIVKAKSGDYQFNQIHLPHYLDKEGFFSLILPTAHVTFKDDFFILPMARAFKKEHCELKFRVPPHIDSNSIKEIRIHPKFKAQFFEIEFVYAKEPIETDLDAEKFLGIDLGLDNLATCVTSDGSAFIVDGKNLKSYNRLFNKENARLQSEKDKCGIKFFTRRQYLNLRKRNRRVNHAMSVAATYSADNPQTYKFSGRRITRGQYRTAKGIVLNADLNGALNILRKSSLISLAALQDRGCVSQPRRIRIF